MIAMIDWGDGEGAALVVGEHSYDQAGLYTVHEEK